MLAHRLSRVSHGLVSATLSFVLVLGIMVSRTPAADVLPSAQLLPAGTVAYATIPDVPAFKKTWGETQFGLMLSDPALQPFLDDIKEKAEGIFAGWEEQIGLTASELFDLPQGEVSLAVIPSNATGFGLIAIVALGENQPNAERLLDRMAQSLADKGGQRRIEDFQGTEVFVFDEPLEADAADPAAQATPQQIAYFIKDQTLVIGWNLEEVQEIAASWEGRADEAFVDSPVFRGINERTTPEGRTPHLQWFIDPVTLLSQMSGMADGNQQAQMAGAMMPMLGLDKLKGIGGTMNFIAGPFDTLSRVHVAIEGPKAGLLNLLNFPSTSLQPEPWVPSDIASYMSLNWDIDTAWRAMADMVNQVQGPGAFEQMLQMATGGQNGPGIDIEAEVVDPISGRLTILGDFEEPITANSQRMLIGVALDDPKTFSATLDKLLQAQAGGAKSREFQGHVLYEIDVPVAPGADVDEQPQGVKMGLAVANDYFFFASNVTLLEKVLRSGDGVEPLGQSLDYRLVASRLPETAGGVSFGRPEQSWRSLYEMTRSGQLRDSMAGAAMVMPSLFELSQAIDGDKLPEFEVVRRYLAPSGGYIESDEKGVLMVGFTLRKESP